MSVICPVVVHLKNDIDCALASFWSSYVPIAEFPKLKVGALAAETAFSTKNASMLINSSVLMQIAALFLRNLIFDNFVSFISLSSGISEPITACFVLFFFAKLTSAICQLELT